MLWIQGEPLGGGERRWLPYEAVHLDFRVPGPEGDGAFFNTSNGLASGNARLEAISHAICELIERDASAQHRAHPEDVRRRCRVDLSTIDDPVCLDILARYDASDIAVAVWEVTTDIGLPVFECLITDRVENPLRALATCFGAGCHPARQVALLRALTEAAQSRLTAIAGSRDDEGRREYARVRAGPTRQRLRALVSDTSHAHRDFHRAPTIDHGSQEEDVAWILARLRRVGLDEVLVVDLSREGIDIPVVKVVIPGLEVSPDMAGYTPGPRARAAMEAR
jgi:YcaO-like protein with predicted kinase domain